MLLMVNLCIYINQEIQEMDSMSRSPLNRLVSGVRNRGREKAVDNGRGGKAAGHRDL